jgi:NADH-quinone oxidoreductase subunit M
MTPFFLVLWLLPGALLAWLLGRRHPDLARAVSLFFLAVQAAVLVALWLGRIAPFGTPGPDRWWAEAETPWIPQIGASFHFGLDGLSLVLCLLTALLGIFSVAASWKGIRERVGFFHFNLLWVLGALTGVFLAIDLLVFYFFWEMILIPLYLLIGIWGHENRRYAALKFFLFTQAGGLFLLLATIGLYLVHGNASGTYTFDYMQLLGTAVPPQIAFWLMLGFGLAFAVKLPAVPLHTWLPDAHAQAPTAGSVILAGLVLKAGAYGFLRFLIPLFPDAAQKAAPAAMALGIAGILYGAILAFAQTDLKRMIAYTSVSHMGFVLLGAFVGNAFALQGAVVILLSHGLSTGALFIMAGALQDRMHTRELGRMGGLWSVVPRMGGFGLLFALASLGLPGLGNFVGEFLVLLGTFAVSPAAALLAALGFIAATVYSLWMMQRVFAGEYAGPGGVEDLDKREFAVFAAHALALLWLGLYPQPVLETVAPALAEIPSAAPVSLVSAATGRYAEAGPVTAEQAEYASTRAGGEVEP